MATAKEVLYYLIYPKQDEAYKHGFKHLTYEVFRDIEECRERAREVDMFPATEWVVLQGQLIGLGLDESIDFFENKKPGCQDCGHTGFAVCCNRCGIDQ